MGVSVRAHGPVFDGRADQELHRAAKQIEEDVGHAAYAEWESFLNAQIRHPTPYYETQITTQREAGHVVVHDRGIIYGFWLEGIGSRNSPVTRFRGYHSRNKAVHSIEPRVKEIAERTLRPYLARMQ